MGPDEIVKPSAIVESVTTAVLLGMILYALGRTAKQIIDKVIAGLSIAGTKAFALLEKWIDNNRADGAAERSAYRSDTMRALDQNTSRVNSLEDRVAELVREVTELRRDVRKDGSITADIVVPHPEAARPSVHTVTPPRGGPKR